MACQGHRFLICDRDTKFTAQFKPILGDAGVDGVLTPKMAPTCNAFIENFVLLIKSECLDWMILFRGRRLREAIGEFIEHYHFDRAHRGLSNCRIEPGVVGEGEVVYDERFDDFLKRYRRAA
ncbi:MAG: putative transposase [Planctomycetota bacterium]